MRAVLSDKNEASLGDTREHRRNGVEQVERPLSFFHPAEEDHCRRPGHAWSSLKLRKDADAVRDQVDALFRNTKFGGHSPAMRLRMRDECGGAKRLPSFAAGVPLKLSRRREFV